MPNRPASTPRVIPTSIKVEKDFIPLRVSFSVLFLLITNKCNLECKHCYVSSSPAGEHGPSLKRMLSLIDESLDILGPLELTISGGEPLVRWQDCLALLQYAAGKHRLRLFTNGTLITDRIAHQLKDLSVRVRLSFDGGNAHWHDKMRGGGSFVKTVEGLNKLRRAGFDDLEIYATITPGGVSAIETILSFAYDFGIDKIKFETLAKGGRAAKFWPHLPMERSDGENQFYKDYFKNLFPAMHGARWTMTDLTPCDVAFNILNVYANGRVYPFTYHDSTDEVLGYMGNINDSTLAEIMSPRTLSRTIVNKFLLLNRGPARSLQAYLIQRR